MLFGGWSRNLADFVTMYDLVSLRNRLRDWGFSTRNMKTFFANGINTVTNTSREDDDDGEYTSKRIIEYMKLKSIYYLSFIIHY